jgi:hypothetical protein
MSHPKEDYESEELNESEQDRTYAFDKFIDAWDRQEQLRREAAQKQQPLDQANRLRDARNREHLHNRLRWSR